MAALEFWLTLEVDHFGDLLAELEASHRALVSRHGARFRQLDRRIDAMMEGPTEAMVDVEHLGGGLFVGVAAPAFSALLADLRGALAT